MKNKTVIIVGGGLSGLTAATYLADAGIDVILLEQGKDYASRCEKNSIEILVGLGGAGTISGGKLCFPPASGAIWKKTQKNSFLFRPFFQNMLSSLHTILPSSQQDVNYASNAIIHKDYHTELVLKDSMQVFVSELIYNAIQKGVTIRCGCRVKNLCRTNTGYVVFFHNEAGEQEYLHGQYIVLATGRTSVPFLQNVLQLKHIHQPDMGIRLTTNINQPAFSIIGKDTKLKQVVGRFLVRTFCVCSGGDSVRTSTYGYTCFDGHFSEQLTNHTNLGILARSPIYSEPRAIEHYLRAMQRYVDAEISLKDFIKYHALLAKGSNYEPLFEALALFISELYRTNMLIQNADEIPVMLPAVDRINPLIRTNVDFESQLPHIYVTGDASGISRGFVQAIWAGYCTAKGIISQITHMQQNREAVS